MLAVLSEYFITDMNLAEMAFQLLPIVLNSPIMSNMDEASSLIEEFRIPEDKTWHYSDDGQYVIMNNQHETTVSLHDFIYGAYWPAD